MGNLGLGELSGWIVRLVVGCWVPVESARVVHCVALHARVQLMSWGLSRIGAAVKNLATV